MSRSSWVVGLALSLASIAAFAQSGHSPWNASLILRKPPASITGIGTESCSVYISIFDAHQKIQRGKEPDVAKIIGATAAFADFLGTFGGYLARIQMEVGLDRPPFKNKEASMEIMYRTCKQHPDSRFIDVVDAFLSGYIAQVISRRSRNKK